MYTFLVHSNKTYIALFCVCVNLGKLEDTICAATILLCSVRLFGGAYIFSKKKFFFIDNLQV